MKNQNKYWSISVKRSFVPDARRAKPLFPSIIIKWDDYNALISHVLSGHTGPILKCSSFRRQIGLEPIIPLF